MGVSESLRLREAFKVCAALFVLSHCAACDSCLCLSSLTVCRRTGVLANLTGLRHLAMLNRLRVSEAGLMHLTALKQLTHLYIDTDAFFTLLLDPLNVHVKHFSFPVRVGVLG